MKLQVLKSSFGKVLSAVAIAFIISSAVPAQAQQQQWGRDNCLYVAQRGQWVRQGCVLPGSQLYLNDATKVFTDLNTRMSFLKGQDGRMMIWTSTGWMDGQAYVAQVRANQPTTPHVLRGAPTMTEEARKSNEDAAAMMTQMQMGGLIKGLAPNDGSATPMPICSLTSGTPCSDGSTRP